MFIKHALSVTSPISPKACESRVSSWNSPYHYKSTRLGNKNPGKADNRTSKTLGKTPMFVHRRSNNKVKVETFLIKRARVQKEIGPCFSHISINLTFTHRLKLPLSSFFFWAKGEICEIGIKNAMITQWNIPSIESRFFRYIVYS